MGKRKLPAKLYKLVRSNGGFTYSTKRGKWPLPKGGKPGAWMPEINGDLEACVNGYHVCAARDLPDWDLYGNAVYEVEVDRSEYVDDGNKFVVRRARLLRMVGTVGDRAWDGDVTSGARFLSLLDKPQPKRAAKAKKAAKR